MEFFDSHCHLTDERFNGDVPAVLARARSAGVTRLVTVASDADDAERCLELARGADGVWCTAGIHPHAASTADAGNRTRIEALAREPEVVAIGETGLDYHYDHSPRAAQRAAFGWHLELAAELGRPVVVHCRDADSDVMAALRDAPPVVGVLHCFSGGRELLDAGLAAGWFVSFAGMVTFRNYGGGDLVRAVPPDRLLIETDSPYLAPVPQRGRRNEPGLVLHVAAGLAAMRSEPEAELVRATTANALRFYGLRS